jgi:hypothetical protein
MPPPGAAARKENGDDEAVVKQETEERARIQARSWRRSARVTWPRSAAPRRRRTPWTP